MKKLISLIITAAITTAAHAQFHATEHGMAADNGDSYVIESAMSDTTLCKHVKKAIARKYGAASLIETDEPYTIAFSTNNPTAFKLKGDMMFNYYAGIVIDVTLNINGNKIEILPPAINENVPVTGGSRQPYPKVAKGNMDFWYIYKPNGKPYHKNAIQRLNDWVNNYINELATAIK